MVAVIERTDANVDMNHPAFEVVQYNAINNVTTYDVKKFRHVDAAFACQSSLDGEDIQVSWEKQANGQPRITLTNESRGTLTGWLVIIGRL